MRVTVSSVITRSKTRRPKPGSPSGWPGDRATSRPARAPAGRARATTAADSSPIAARCASRELGEPDHRAPFRAPQPGLVKARDGAAEARARLVNLAGVGGVAGGLDLERRDQALRSRVISTISCALRELRVRRRHDARLREPACARSRAISAASSSALVGIERVVRASSGSDGAAAMAPSEKRAEPGLDEPRAARDAGRERGVLARGRQAGPGGRLVVARGGRGSERELDPRELVRIPPADGLAPGGHESRVRLVVACASEQHRRQPRHRRRPLVPRRLRERGLDLGDPVLRPSLDRFAFPRRRWMHYRHLPKRTTSERQTTVQPRDEKRPGGPSSPRAHTSAPPGASFVRYVRGVACVDVRGARRQASTPNVSRRRACVSSRASGPPTPIRRDVAIPSPQGHQRP